MKNAPPKKEIQKTIEGSTTLPPDIIHSVLDFVSQNSDQNCGKFLQYLRSSRADFKTMSAGLKKQLQNSVGMTLRTFRKRFGRTSVLRFSALKSPGRPTPVGIETRIWDTIELAYKTTDPTILVDYCRRIVEWKKEAQQIVNQLRNVVQYIDDYRRHKIPLEHFMGNLVVYSPGGNVTMPVRDDIHQLNHHLPTNDPRFNQQLKKLYITYKKKLQRDEQALVTILKPVDINVASRHSEHVV